MYIRNVCIYLPHLTHFTTASDLAYETMFDEDEGMGLQTMPWFDPNYIAGNVNEEVCMLA